MPPLTLEPISVEDAVAHLRALPPSATPEIDQALINLVLSGHVIAWLREDGEILFESLPDPN